MEPEIFIKLAPRAYRKLLDEVDPSSPAQDAIKKATPIDHALEGVQFAGYTIPCTEEQARVILKTAERCCPAAVAEIRRAIELAQAG